MTDLKTKAIGDRLQAAQEAGQKAVKKHISVTDTIDTVKKVSHALGDALPDAADPFIKPAEQIAETASAVWSFGKLFSRMFGKKKQL